MEQLVYIGQDLLRHDSEFPFYKLDRKNLETDLAKAKKRWPNMKAYASRDDYAKDFPGAVVHVFVHYTREPTFKEFATDPKFCARGSSGVKVEYDKLVRDQSTIGQVETWREGFLLQNADGEEPYVDEDGNRHTKLELLVGPEGIVEKWDEIILAKGKRLPKPEEMRVQRFVILNAIEPGLGVPLTNEDKLALLETKLPTLWIGLGFDKADDDEKFELLATYWDDISAAATAD